MPTDNLVTEWGRNLTRARQANRLSIAELARRTGMHKSHLARFERGEAGIGDAMRIRVATEVGQQVADLFPYPDITDQETPCPSAATAPGEASNPTPATRAVTPSPVRHAAARAASEPEENPGNE